jgi:hypothetical protein
VAVAAGPFPPVVLDFSGTFTAGVGVAAPAGCGTGVSASKSADWVFPATDSKTGTPLKVSKIALTSTASGDPTRMQDADLFFFGPDGKQLGSATTGSANEALALDGPFAAGTYKVSYNACASVNMGFTVHGEATVVAA